MGFDVDACCVAYDGERAWATPRARRAINVRVNVVDETRQSLTYESRLLKYGLRGFAVCVPGLDKSKIAPNLLDRDIANLSGLGKLLVLEHAVELSRQMVGLPTVRRTTLRRRFDRVSPYGGSDHASKNVDYTIDAVANPAASDYSGFNHRPRRGFHPYGLVSIFIKGALSAGTADVPCVAARNSMEPILDAGGESREVTMQLWCSALNRDLFGSYFSWRPPPAPIQALIAAHNAAREPGMSLDAAGNDIHPNLYGCMTRQQACDPNEDGSWRVTFSPAVPRSITFVTHDAGRQMIGSFHPKQGDFFKDAYDRAAPG